ncbi:phosphatidylglycerol lysyltransferase domain-containing protein [Actinomyces mediterranea]|uniref:phosphatidylglycerol lysyltransferase domain-containing protein n=1 Tax=Actinomyces mediterranea TaxID=1871028 RepID=UPI00101AD576|nr:phosphatidylglycerol lysyltransferase domain-containing protein [Actinomyces mediterranea]
MTTVSTFKMHATLSLLRRTLRRATQQLRRTPASTAAAVSILLASIAASYGAFFGEGLGATAGHPDRLWALVTSFWSAPTWYVGLALALAFVVIGGIIEAAIGARRWITAVVLSGIGGILITQATDIVFRYINAEWAQSGTESTPLNSAAFGLMGLIFTGSAWMQVLGRRRLRAFLLAALGVLVAFGGAPQSTGALGSALIGLILGIALAPRGENTRSFIGTRHRGRSIVALVIVTLSAGSVLTIVSAQAVGPLSFAALGIIPTDFTVDALMQLCSEGDVSQCARATNALRTEGVAPLIIMMMPFLLQCVLAWGVARGRRVAAIATLALQTFFALLALARLFLFTEPVFISEVALTEVEIALPETTLSQVLSAVIIPLSLIALIVWNRKWFAVRTPRSVLVRSGSIILVTAVVIGGVVILLGLNAPQSTMPEATTWLLASNYAARILPPTALSLLTPTLLPVTWIGRLLIEWAPILTWMTTIVAALATVMASPKVPNAPTAERSPRDFVATARSGSLGWMNTWPGNEQWISADGSALIAYRRVAGVALTITDPAARPENLHRVVAEFATYATSHSMIPALYSVHANTARVAHQLGWTTMKVAEEAVMDLPALAFTGKKWQDVRTAINRAAKEGITAEWTTLATCPEGVLDQIRAISSAWVDEKALPEMGFTLGGMNEMAVEETRLLLARDEEGTVHAVTSWLPVYNEGELIGLTLDVMRKRDGGFRPSIEFLLGRAALDAKEEGLQILSLSGAPLAHSGLAAREPDLEESGAERFAPVLDYVGSLLEPVYGFRSLLFFKKKFQPRFEPLYLAVPDMLDIPTVGIAISRSYLPDMSPADAARFARTLLAEE